MFAPTCGALIIFALEVVLILFCFISDYDGFILYSKVTGMESINLRDGNNPNAPYEPFQNQTHLRNVIGLSFDYNSKRIFFSDIQRGDIQFVHFDKTNYTTIVEGMMYRVSNRPI